MNIMNKIKILLTNKCGASLLELMVAIVIFAIVISQTMFMEVAAYRLIESTNRAEMATNFAREKMEEFRALPGIAIPIGTTTEAVEEGRYSFNIISNVQNFDAGGQTKRVTVTVEWRMQGRTVWNREVSLTGVIR